jgi:signal transduction histidine kinase
LVFNWFVLQLNCITNLEKSFHPLIFYIRQTLPTYLKFAKQLSFGLSIGGILILLCSFSAYSQSTTKVDSLKLLLESSRDTTRFRILSELFKATNRSDYEEALVYAKSAFDQAEAMGDSVKIVEGGRMMAYSLDDLGRNEEAIIILNKVIRIAQRNQDKYPKLKTILKFLYNNAGIAYMYLGKYDSSLNYHLLSLEIRETEGDKKSIGTAQNNIGLVYFNLRNYERALEYYLNSLRIKGELNDNSDIDKILINVGLCYNELGKPNQAIESFNSALSNCNQNCSEDVIKATNFGLGRAYYRINEFSKSKEFFIISLEISKKQNDTRYIIENLNNLGANERILKDFNKSIEHLKEANQLAHDNNFTELQINIFKELSKTYNATNNFENAAMFQDKYIKLKDSIYSGDLIKNLARIQTNYDQRENLKTIKLNAENIKLKDEQLQRQRLQYFFIVLVTLLIIILAMVLLWANRRQHVHNAALSEAKRVIEDQNKQLTVTNEELDNRVQEKTQDLFDTNETLIQVNDELDNFVYRTSHDLRGPLVTLKGVCNVAMLDVKDELAQDYLKRLDITAAKLNAILTRLLVVNQVNHTDIEASRINLEFAINDVITLEKEKGIPAKLKIDYTIDPDVTLISDIRLVKIVLENLIDNGIKFYNTSDRIIPFVKIKISRAKRGNIRFYVEDNGIGINSIDKDQIFHLFVRASERSETGGIGLYLTKLASQRLGGGVKLLETSDKGSKFLVLLPGDINPILAKRKALEEQRLIEKERRERERREKGVNDDPENFI